MNKDRIHMNWRHNKDRIHMNWRHKNSICWCKENSIITKLCIWCLICL